MRTVLVSQIGGSIGRCTEFDGEFMPIGVRFLDQDGSLIFLQQESEER